MERDPATPDTQELPDELWDRLSRCATDHNLTCAADDPWIQATEARRGSVARLVQVWEIEPRFRRLPDTSQAWSRFLDRTAVPSRRYAPSQRIATPRWKRGVGVIAGVAVVAMFAYLAIPSNAPRNAPQGSPRTYTTTTGQLATIDLPDGSRMTLAPNSRISLPAGFGHATRTIELIGQAYFQIGAASGTPFIVRTGAVSTQVLGTAFDVTRYPGDFATRVVVAEGKVQSVWQRPRAATHSVVLTAGMVGDITDSSATERRIDDTTPYTEWTRGRLTFQSATVAEVVSVLERWYDLRFTFADSALAAVRMSASFDFDTPSEALAYLKTVLGVHMTYSVRGDTTVVTLHAHAPKSTPAPSRREQQQFQRSFLEVGR